MRHLLVIKLAAIGDVTIATQALASRGGALKSGSWTVHWILDHGLVPYARALHEELGLPVRYYGINSAALFRGSKIRQIWEALRVAAIVRFIRPDMAAVLHRDDRYARLLKLAGVQRMELMPRKTARESGAMEALFERLGLVADTPETVGVVATTKNSCRRKLRIGILVGGGRNQKVLYREKTWPHFGDLALILARSGRYEISLFGASEDRAAADEIMERLEKEMPHEASAYDFVGALMLEQLPGAIRQLDALLSVDTGPAHLAALLFDKPHQRVFTLFGPTDPEVWAPTPRGPARVVVLTQKLECAPCYKNDGAFTTCRFSGREFAKCMTELNAVDVYTTMDRELTQPS